MIAVVAGPLCGWNEWETSLAQQSYSHGGVLMSWSVKGCTFHSSCTPRPGPFAMPRENRTRTNRRISGTVTRHVAGRASYFIAEPQSAGVCCRCCSESFFCERASACEVPCLVCTPACPRELVVIGRAGFLPFNTLLLELGRWRRAAASALVCPRGTASTFG